MESAAPSTVSQTSSAAQGAAASPPASPQAKSPMQKPVEGTEAHVDDVSTPPLSDADMDAEFQEARAKKPSRGRPTSQAALAFSKQLDDMFLIDDNLDKLSQNINQKKQSVSYQSSELAALEARIKAAEMLLRERKKDAGLEEDTPAEEQESRPAEEAKTEEPAAVESTPAPVPEPEPVKEEPEEEEVEESEEEEPEPPRRSKRRSKYVPGVNWSISDYEGKRYQIRPPPPPPAVPTGI